MEVKLCEDFYYRVKKGDSLNSIKKKFNSSNENILRNDDKIPLFEGEIIRIKVNDFFSYVVKPMDNIEKICKKFNIKKENLIKDNKLVYEKLFIGQQLKIYKNKNII